MWYRYGTTAETGLIKNIASKKICCSVVKTSVAYFFVYPYRYKHHKRVVKKNIMLSSLFERKDYNLFITFLFTLAYNDAIGFRIFLLYQ